MESECDVGLASYGIAKRNCVGKSSCAVYSSRQTFESSIYPHLIEQDQLGCNRSTAKELVLKMEAVCMPITLSNSTLSSQSSQSLQSVISSSRTETFEEDAKPKKLEKERTGYFNMVAVDHPFLRSAKISNSSSAQKHLTSCVSSWISDGWCDSVNNNAACNYDGGDCCSSTCVSSSYTCGVAGYDCRGYPSSTCYSSWQGDGECDDNLGCNTRATNYDGGDCCSPYTSDCYDCSQDGWYCGGSIGSTNCDYGGCYMNAVCDSCHICQAGKYSTRNNQWRQCQTCSSGKYCSSGLSSCSTCSSGKYSSSGSSSCCTCLFGK